MLLSAEAVAAAARLAAVAEAEPGDAGIAYLLGALHQLRCEILPTDEDRDAAEAATVFWFGRAVAATAIGDPNRAGLLSGLGWALQARFERHGRLPDVDGAIEADRAAVSATPEGHPDLAMFLTNLGNALQLRFERLGNLPDLDEAIRVGLAAVAATPPDDPDRASYLSNLGPALQLRFGRVGDLADLHAAVEAARDAVAATPSGHPSRAGRLSNLGAALLARFERLGELTDLDGAVEAGRAAVSLTPDHHPDRGIFLSGLGAALQARFERLGELADLQAALDATRAAVAATPAGHPNRPRYLSKLHAVLHARFERVGELADLREAIEVARAAVAATSSDHPDRAGQLANLGGLLRARFERVGDLADLQEAIEVAHAAVAASPPDHPSRALLLSALGITLRIRFERVGDLADLDEAIEAGRAAAGTTPADHPDRAGFLVNLAVALAVRFGRVGGLADLDEAIATVRTAVATTPAEHPGRAMALSNLGGGLQARFERLGDLTDVDEAIAVSRAAIAATPPDHPHRAMFLSNLGNALRLRFERLDEQPDLDGAIEAGRAAVTATPPDHPQRASFHNNLGNALRLRFERLGERRDLDEAIEVGRAAVTATPLEHPARATRLSNLSNALHARFLRLGEPADLDEAAASLEAGLGSESAATAVRVRCGARLGRLLAGRDWAGADRVLTAVLGLLPQLMDRSLTRGDRQHLLGEFAGVGTAAAAAALADGDVDRAWAALEQGRGVLLGQALETSAEPDLRRAHPDLAEEIDRVRRELNAETGGEGLTSGPPEAAIDGVVRARRRAAAEWARLVETIRARPGFARFALPPTVEELRRGLGDSGVAVAINVTSWRCDALILSQRGADHLRLPDLHADDAVTRANAFLAATRSSGGGARSQQLRDVLDWLWTTVTGPVLEHLGFTEPVAEGGRWPRVWWSPTGALTVLPLHAAASGGASVLDRVVSSYTPTIRLLVRAGHPSQLRVLGVGLDNAPGHPPLSFAAAEARAVCDQLAAPAPLVDDSATLTAVRAGLATAGWAHFACHGVPGRDPADSHLPMWDGPLPVREIANLDLPTAHLAYLSACTTAFGGTTLLDESIHIASAFRVAGFAHVVATLWAISDRQAPRLARAFYERLTEGDDPAHATHHAVRSLRAKLPENPYLWAPYVHFGS